LGDWLVSRKHVRQTIRNVVGKGFAVKRSVLIMVGLITTVAIVAAIVIGLVFGEYKDSSRP